MTRKGAAGVTSTSADRHPALTTPHRSLRRQLRWTARRPDTRRTPSPPGAISTITLAKGPVAIYAGSSTGLYSAADSSSLLTQDHFPGAEVRAIAVDPTNPFERWVASGSGVWFTWVFGHDWTTESGGLTNPNGASALTFYRNNLYVSDLAGVYRWDTTSAWKQVLDEIGVISLTSSRDLLIANSYSSAIAVYDGRSWRQVGSGLSGHAHSGGQFLACAWPRRARRRRALPGATGPNWIQLRWRPFMVCAGQRLAGRV